MSRPGTLALTASSGLLALLSLGCQPQQTQDIPNRVLDRPTDTVLVCVETQCTDFDGDGETTEDECETLPVAVSECSRDSGSCTSDNPHLVGFVANSERNEVAMFTKCANRLVDMNIEIPGYNFIPTGVLPTDLAVSSDGCRVMAGNVGSCDLSVLDAPALASFGLGRTETIDEPASLVSNLEPRRYDDVDGRWRPLGARPGEIVAVPSTLTQAPGLDPDSPLTGLCDPLTRGSVYITFPTCNVVAEVDVQTGYILQSRQFVSDGDGAIDVIDTGISPICPVECPTQFEEGLPGDLPAVDQGAPFPQALALSVEPAPASEGNLADEADAAVDGQRLFIGGLGSEIVFEVPIEDSGQWGAIANQLELADAGGIKRIVVSPGVDLPAFDSEFSQYLYVVAGDGSTRVVGRALPADPSLVGVECETQLDPQIAPDAITGCRPITIVPSESPPADRRGFSRGPGIRPGRGEEITDWVFRKTYEGEETLGPFAEPGVLAVGVTTGGGAIYTMLNQERALGETTVDDLAGLADADPAGIMDVRLFPHSLWPEPGFEGPGNQNRDDFLVPPSLPTVDDSQPLRQATGILGPTRFLSPSLRRIDATYLAEDGVLNVDADFDQLGNGFMYEEDVPRIAVHDYRSWGSGEWSLAWEGAIPGTTSSSGRLACDTPGWEGGTCLVDEPDDARLLDSTASFCEAGVLAGDKLVLGGCTSDAQCGEGRRCLRETVGGGESTGICISAEAYENRAAELRVVCADFISDPCGEAFREFTITRAFEDELWIQSMDLPLTSHLQDITDTLPPCEEGDNNAIIDDVCQCLPGFTEEACEDDDPDDGIIDCCTTGEDPTGVFEEIEDRFICADEQPDGGCLVDLDCAEFLGEDDPWVCVEERCRRPCEDGDDCIFRRLPGPACFGEFVPYQVALRNSFRLSGPGVTFVSQLVEVDPDTGECRQTLDPEISPLLTSRLPLPNSDDPLDPDWQAIPVCAGDTVEPSSPNPCRIDQTRTPLARFHNFEFYGETVAALRFSNPVMSLVMDLTSLQALTDEIPDHEGELWPPGTQVFRRSRIPRGYQETFRLSSGYFGFAYVLSLEGRPVTFPIRIVEAPPEFNSAGRPIPVAFIVDGSGPGASSSIRGQVIRVLLTTQVASDEAFTGVR